MSRYYSSEYYSYSMPVSEDPALKSFLKKKRDRYAVSAKGLSGKILCMFFPPDIIKLYSGIPLDRRILDVGCGNGNLAWRLREAGFTNVMGVDPFNEDTIVYPNGVRVEKKSLKEIEGQWDLITYHHSFEHIATPVEELKKTSELLSEKGKCIIRIPVVDSWAWEHYKTDWVQIDAPRHFFLYSVKSLKILAEKAGFTVGEVEYDSTDFQFWGSEQYRNNISLTESGSYQINQKASRFSKKEIRSFERKATDLNARKTGDQAIFHLRGKH
jgi:SAM-dependent methyltransferase